MYKRQVFKERPYICDFSILKDVNEKKACRFAAELLFPEEALKREINDYCRRLNIKEVKTLDFAQIASFIIVMTVKYQMPLKAVIYRLAEEKYIGNVKEYIEKYPHQYYHVHHETLPMGYHAKIRSIAACYESSELAVRLARIADARLHILHISTARELSLFDNDIPLEEKRITAEACVSHLLFDSSDYPELGARIKCNPSIKTKTNRDALRQAVNSNLIDVIATDHAPHLLKEKEGGPLKAMSGMPMIQFSLVSMLELVNEGIFTIEKVVEKMCHAPAQIYNIHNLSLIHISEPTRH